MITSPIDYYSKILQIKDFNKPQYALLLPSDETIYEINLNTREVKAPKFLSLNTDHYAETIYFKVDRFFDNMDLADTVCVISFVNDGVKKLTGTEDEGHVYLVPFVDIFTCKDEGKMLIPWQISNTVAAAPGNITFSFRFYKLDDTGKNFVYSLNTLEAKSKVLSTLDLKLPENDEGYFEAGVVDKFYAEINAVKDLIGPYWIEA